MSDLETIISAVTAARKYRGVCRDTVARIAQRELAAHGSVKAATKATKRRLHQIYGAFEREADYELALQEIESAYASGAQTQIEASCRPLLGLHTSTRERLPILDTFYPAIFQITGHPDSLLDLGCGLNPLALPWMGLAPGTRYIALDIDQDRTGFLNRYLAIAEHPPLARCQDILSRLPTDSVDMALLLKMSTTLERQEPGSTARLVDGLDSPFVVVSFAVASLGGRDVGMARRYQEQFLELASKQSWTATQLAFDSELAFVIGR